MLQYLGWHLTVPKIQQICWKQTQKPSTWELGLAATDVLLWGEGALWELWCLSLTELLQGGKEVFGFVPFFKANYLQLGTPSANLNSVVHCILCVLEAFLGVESCSPVHQIAYRELKLAAPEGLEFGCELDITPKTPFCQGYLLITPLVLLWVKVVFLSEEFEALCFEMLCVNCLSDQIVSLVSFSPLQ